MGENFAGAEKLLHAGLLVGRVHLGIKAGEDAAEGHAAGDIVDIGAAANEMCIRDRFST